ncbi:hypothetical protein TIFTF001_001141 [Ficus carica]|uniref:Uncharacterized protein n=1 Tax=Ficus carica TaxID=3494 RepID=A0AA87ZED0_FICCA|nr:hypothetical protein TIFTF001_001141 [Ficus carica]
MLPTNGGGSLKLVRAFLVLLVQIHWAFALNSSVGGTQIRCLEKERQALVSLFPLKTTEDCCKWEGVQCSNETNHVIAIHVLQPIQGTIDRSLMELQQLESLNLSSIQVAQIPPFLGFLSNLRYLDLSSAGVTSTIPIELGNLLKLESLDLSGNSNAQVENLTWLSNLSSLVFLDLSMLNLSKATDWLQIINRLPQLRTLRLGGCDLPSPIFSSLPPSSESQAILEELDLHGNRLMSSIFPWLFNHSSAKIFSIDVSNNQLNGLIPDAFGNMNLLEHLNLSHNQLQGGIPDSFGSLCSLRELYLTRNRISGQLDTFLETLSKCSENSLGSLTTELLPDVTNLPLLKTLDLSDNLLSGTIPEVIGNLSELETLYVGGNSLEGVISEVHFLKLAKLKYLNLSSNSLLLNFHDDWVSPFQLDTIRVGSLKLGSRFPEWIRTQNNFSELDISNASISGTIPSWFWSALSSKSCRINLSHNQLSGSLENLSIISLPSSPELNLGSNQLEGPIPSIFFGATSLDLSNNYFSGISFPSESIVMQITLIDFSNNSLSGELPDWFLGNLRALQLRNNKFSGELPASWFFRNLQVLDLGENEISGPVPQWIGDGFPNLIVLSLRSNNFSGSIPSNLCQLRRIQLFDLSDNNISGDIPTCLNNLTSLTEKVQNGNATIRIPYTSGLGSLNTYKTTFEGETSMNWKGQVYEYKSNLGYVKCFDLSNNYLAGQIPAEITHLVGLVFLNLSWNSLTGQIPHDIGDLKELDALDLSRNRLHGEIPQSLSQIDRIGVLNLSYNNLSGRIPTGSTQLQGFNATVYAGNPGLCGFPLKDCEAPEPEGSSGNEQGENEEGGYITRGFYISMGLGFVIGFWIVIGTLIFNSPWRFKYLKFLNSIYDWLYVMGLVSFPCRCALVLQFGPALRIVLLFL